MQLTIYLNERIQKKKQRRNEKVKEKNKSMAENMNPILKVILEGVYDDRCQLSLLRGTPHIVQLIYSYIMEYWKSLIVCGDADDTIKEIAHNIGHNQLQPGEIKNFPGNQFFLETAKANFPQPQNLDIHMMPFLLERSFEKCYLPDNLRLYWENMIKPLFRTKNGDCQSEEGKVCYLSIYEGLSDSFITHDRSGLHVISSRRVTSQQDENSSKCIVKKDYSIKANGTPILRLSRNMWDKDLITRYNKVEGGIFMASNVPNLCAVWNSRIRIDPANNNTDIIGANGDIAHLRKYIGKREAMNSNKIYWITDRTPIEFCLPSDRAYIQYFRIDTHQLPVWYEALSTKNSLGVFPNSNITRIVKSDKS